MEQMQENDRKAILKELIGKSWNLELIISGAAIVLTTYLPELVERQFYLFHYNLSYEWFSGMGALPILAYAFFKTVAWLLIGMFVVHLIMRAFWVAMIGLSAAFPQGIQYDRLPNMPASQQQYYEKKYGRLDDYVVSLDRLCNRLLAFAFLVALMGIMVGVLYYAIFYITQLFNAVLSPAMQELVGNIVGFAFMALALFLLIANWALKAKPELDARYGKYMTRLSIFFKYGFLPVLHRPIAYLTMTFTSNISKKRYYLSLVGVMLVVMSTVFITFMQKIGELRSAHLLEYHQFYAAGAPQAELIPDKYDNLRTFEARIPLVSLSSDMVTDPFLKVFVVYPKMLDVQIAQQCTLPEIADSLPRPVRSAIRDSAQLECMRNFFKLYINDSLYAQPAWVYHEKPGTTTLGLMAYLPTAGFKTGKNMLWVKIPSRDKPDSLQVFGAAPFWFAESK